MRKSQEMLAMMSALSMVYDEPARQLSKVCKHAKGNNKTFGKKCKHGGSCDGTKRCRFAIY